MTAPPFAYFGGKTSLASKVVRLLPGHEHYVEPFGGSLAVLLAKPSTGMETVNDLDADLMTFWRVLRERPTELIRSCALTPHSRGEHQDAYDRDGYDDLERARRVWVMLTQGRGGVPVRSGWRHYVAPAGATGLPAYLSGYVERMAAAAERLQHVSLECRPALELIGRYGQAPGVLLYVDPPYLGAARCGRDDPRQGTRRYRHEMLADGEHRELAIALAECRASVVVSGYPSALYDDLYDGWFRAQFTTGTGQSARGEWSTRTEVLWSNRPLSGSQFDLFAQPGAGVLR